MQSNSLNPPEVNDLDGLITLDQAAQLLGVTRSTMYSKTSSTSLDPIPHFRRGKRCYFEKKVLAAWVRNSPQNKK